MPFILREPVVRAGMPRQTLLPFHKEVQKPLLDIRREGEYLYVDK
jgi:hypothetical protein